MLTSKHSTEKLLVSADSRSDINHVHVDFCTCFGDMILRPDYLLKGVTTKVTNIAFFLPKLLESDHLCL